MLNLGNASLDFRRLLPRQSTRPRSAQCQFRGLVQLVHHGHGLIDGQQSKVRVRKRSGMSEAVAMPEYVYASSSPMGSFASWQPVPDAVHL